MPANNLPQIKAAYTTTMEIFAAIKLIVKNHSLCPSPVAKLLPTLLANPSPQMQLDKSREASSPDGACGIRDTQPRIPQAPSGLRFIRATCCSSDG